MTWIALEVVLWMKVQSLATHRVQVSKSRWQSSARRCRRLSKQSEVALYPVHAGEQPQRHRICGRDCRCSGEPFLCCSGFRNHCSGANVSHLGEPGLALIAVNRGVQLRLAASKDGKEDRALSI